MKVSRPFSLLIALGLWTCSVVGQELDCQPLRIGIFETTTGSVGTVVVERTAKWHWETIPSLDKRSKYAIEWTGPCAFTIRYRSGDKPPGPDADKPIDCWIINLDDDTHTVRARIRDTEIIKDYTMARH
jgi:hypothetical protein